MPTISVIIPLHNKAPYVGHALRSLQDQSYQNWEALVVENHSSDGGAKVVEGVSNCDPRIRLLRAPARVVGPGAARNYGLERASGDWVMFLDADDLLRPEHLESLLEAVATYGRSMDVAVSDWLEFPDGNLDWPDGVSLSDLTGAGMERHYAAGSEIPASNISVQDSSIAYAPWAVHCGMIRRSCLDHDRCWVEALDCYPSEDTAFWFRVLLGRRIAYTRQPTALYRTETPNFRNTYTDLARWSKALEAIHGENLNFLNTKDCPVNSNQAESLMRVWSRLGWEANKAALHETSSTAYRESERFLALSTSQRFPIKIRRFFGCRRFDSLRDKIRFFKFHGG